MVRICSALYIETKYADEFAKYPYPLSDFQKYAIEGIIEGQHVLVTAHTGSGKTLPA
jgi:superfamily II RNA helicase